MIIGQNNLFLFSRGGKQMNKLFSISIKGIIILSALVVATHAKANGLSFPFSGYIDSYDTVCTADLNPRVTPLQTPVLTDGQPYLITVRGTMSVWTSSAWDSVCLGTPEDEPIYPTSASTEGKVGMDPAYYFAIKSPSPLCTSFGYTPYPVAKFTYQSGSGADWSRPRPLIDEYNVDTHSYQYLIVGTGTPANLSIHDYPCTDNYGKFFVTVEEIDAGGFATGGGNIYDLVGNKATFGFTARNKNGDVKGSLEYQDHAGLNLHSNTIFSVILINNTAIIEGEVEICPDTSPCDIVPFTLVVYDGGEPGGGTDTFKLTVDGNVLVDNYIEYGNIQIHHK
jgi:hypothetical protein